MSVTRNLIEYFGISDYLPEDNISFTKINIEDEVGQVREKLHFKEIGKVYSNANILNIKVVKTLQGQSFEGINLTGKKVIISGEVDYKVEYSADNDENSIHTLNHTIPFITSVSIPNNVAENSLVNAEVFIEDINSFLINNEIIYLSSILLITIVP